MSKQEDADGRNVTASEVVGGMQRQRDAGMQLQVSEEFKRTLMDASPDCVKVLDLDGRVVHMNTPGLCAMEIDDFGTVCGQEWEALWPPSARADIQHSRTKAAGGEVSSFEAFCPTAKGRSKWWEVTVSPVRDALGGQVVQLLSISRDITERKRAEDRLRASEAQFRAIFEQSSVPMAQLSAKTGHFMKVNSKYSELTGYSLEELAGMTPTDLDFVEDSDASIKEIGPLLRGEVASYDQEKRYSRKDRKIIWVHVNATLLRDAEGRPERTMAVVLDITDRKSAQADRDRLLLQAEAERGRLADVFRQAPSFMCVLRGPDHVFELANDRYYQLVGQRDLIGLAAREALPEVEGQGFFELLDEVYETGKSFTGSGLAVRLERQTGQPPEELVIDLVYQALRGPDGALTGIVAVGEDVTDRLRANELLRVSEGRFRSLVTATTQIVWTSTADGVVVEDSPSWRAFTGQTVEQWLGWGWVNAIHADDREVTVAAWQRALAAKAPITAEYRLRRHDDQYRWMTVRAVPVMDQAGVLRELIGTNTDITEQKQAEQALRYSEERMRAATSVASDLIWTNNANGSMEGEQRGWGEFTGQSRKEYQGDGWSNAVHPEDAQPTIDEWNRAVAEKRPFVFEHRLLRHDGQWRICSVRAVPIFNADGTTREWVGVHTDITDRKHDEEKLQHLAAELSEVNHRKDEFLATLAHELRNPLAPIRNGLQLMKLAEGRGAVIEQSRSMMERQVTQMVRLVDDLMDVSRISRGKLELRKEQVLLTTVLNSAVETSRPLIDQMGHQLTLLLPNEPLIVYADTTRLAQVFMNLLNNAAKYSERAGHIQLKVEREGGDAVVTVKDEGIGIAADQLTLIFEMFTQVDRSLHKAQGGLGIGLMLVKQLVEMHGGRVDGRSEGLGRGSEFVVRLPVMIEALKPQASGPESRPEASMKLLRILVVDDNRDGANSLTDMLEIMGNETCTAYDGQQAVELAAEYRPDVVLLDIGLPKLNGYEACRRIREQPWGKDILLIAVTDWGQDKDRRRSSEAGFDHHLVKPVDPQVLMRMLARADAGLERS